MAGGVNARTDHDRSIGAHAIGNAIHSSWQKAETDHAARGRPAEGLIAAAGGIARTDHDLAVGAHAIGNA